MSETGFTKGELVLDGPDEFGDYTISAKPFPLAICAVVSNLRPAEEVRANAHLLVASKDMYAALEVLRDLLVGTPYEGSRVLWPLFAALSKARGEQEHCPGHVASDTDPKVCRHCGTHIDEYRQIPEEEQRP